MQTQHKNPPIHRFAKIAVCGICVLVVIGALIIGFAKFDGSDTTNANLKDPSAGQSSTLVSFENSEIYVGNEDEARMAVSAHLGLGDIEGQLGECSESKVLGETYYRFQQIYEGVPVYGHGATLNVGENGACLALSSNLADMEGCSTQPSISEEEAKAALQDGSDSYTDISDPSLFLYNIDDSNYELAYAFDAYQNCWYSRIFISASSGTVLKKENLSSTENVGTLYESEYGITAYDACKKEVAPVPEIGLDEYGNTYTLAHDENNTWYFVNSEGSRFLLIGDDDTCACKLIDPESGVAIAQNAGVSICSFTADGTTLFPANIDWFDMDEYDNRTMRLIENTVSTYDFYDAVLGVQSYNGANGKIALIANATLNINGKKQTDNAVSGIVTPYQTTIVFGYENAVNLDTVAHEFTHSATKSIIRLQSEGETGAINEAISDIFGELVEDYCDNGLMDNSCNWDGDTRNYADPSKSHHSENFSSLFSMFNKAHPSTYLNDSAWGSTTPEKDNNENTANDNGHIHNNSTVISHAAYLMCNGDLEGEALMTDELARVLYSSLHLLTSTCDFPFFAEIVENKAADLLSQDKAKRVENAFKAVGIEAPSAIKSGTALENSSNDSVNSGEVNDEDEHLPPSIEPVSKNDSTPSPHGNIPYVELYKPVLTSYSELPDEGRDSEYMLYDLDDDGILELLVDVGASEMARVVHVYTICEGSSSSEYDLMEIGSFTAWHSSLRACEGRGIYSTSYGAPGMYSANLISKEGTELTVVNVIAADTQSYNESSEAQRIFSLPAIDRTTISPYRFDLSALRALQDDVTSSVAQNDEGIAVANDYFEVTLPAEWIGKVTFEEHYDLSSWDTFYWIDVLYKNIPLVTFQIGDFRSIQTGDIGNTILWEENCSNENCFARAHCTLFAFILGTSASNVEPWISLTDDDKNEILRLVSGGSLTLSQAKEAYSDMLPGEYYPIEPTVAQSDYYRQVIYPRFKVKN